MYLFLSDTMPQPCAQFFFCKTCIALQYVLLCEVMLQREQQAMAAAEELGEDQQVLEMDAEQFGEYENAPLLEVADQPKKHGATKLRGRKARRVRTKRH